MSNITNTNLSESNYIIPEATLRQKYDRRNSTQKIVDIILSFFREAHYGLIYIANRIFTQFHYPTCDESIQWQKESKVLYVLIHGYKGHPSVWNNHIRELKKTPDVDVFAPFVPNKGNCRLEKAAQPILNKILDYMRKYPGKPICLIGLSNGSRIATWLEVQLRSISPQTPIRVSTVAGIHFGTSLMNLVSKFKILHWFVKKCIREELAHGSQKACQILDEVLKPSPNIVRAYEFWGSTEDYHVPCLGSSLPLLNKNESHFVVHGYGHNSILRGIYKQQLLNCESWRKKF